MVEVPIKLHLQGLAKQANAATRALALMTGQERAVALEAMAERLETSMEDVLTANKRDLDAIPKEWGPDEYRKAREQISMTENTLLDMVAFIRKIAEEPDPTGEVSQGWLTQDGLHVHRVRVPIGVIAVTALTLLAARWLRLRSRRSGGRGETSPPGVR